MKQTYCQTFPITAMDVDCFGRAKTSTLLYFAQETAGGHCLQLALDWDTLAKRRLFWAVSRYKLQITRLPVLGETVTVKTWPMPTTRAAFPRATAGYDEKGNELFRAVGLWVLMDMDKRSMVLPGKSGVDLTGTLIGNELALPNSLIPRQTEQSVLRQVGYSELDRNRHMNNTRYLDWVNDLLPATFHEEHTAKEMTLCYLSEALEHEQIRLNWHLNEDCVLCVDAYRQTGESTEKQNRIFAAEIVF